MGKSTQSQPKGSTHLKGTDRRATVRYRCAPPNQCRAFFANSSKSIQAAVVDLSLGGIGLVLETYVEPGTLVGIEMSNGGAETIADLVANVTYATSLDDGRWRCGCEWLRPLTEEELQVLRD
jgi:c-di-GMP-binding flagellar brake protein YcgR